MATKKEITLFFGKLLNIVFIIELFVFLFALIVFYTDSDLKALLLLLFIPILLYYMGFGYILCIFRIIVLLLVFERITNYNLVKKNFHQNKIGIILNMIGIIFEAVLSFFVVQTPFDVVPRF